MIWRCSTPALRDARSDAKRLSRLTRLLAYVNPLVAYRATLLGFLLGSHIVSSTAYAQGPTEYQIKAAFLYNFAKFVDWPDETAGAIRLCVVGDDPFGTVLEDTIKGKTINGRHLEIRRLKAGEDLHECQIVFISKTERQRWRSILEALGSANALTVGDAPGLAQEGAIINFILEDNKVRFEINNNAAQRAHLRISSRLLSLARIVNN